MKSPNELRADIDVLNIEFGDAELFDRNAAFDHKYAQAERRASRAVAAAVVAFTLLLIAFAVFVGQLP